LRSAPRGDLASFSQDLMPPEVCMALRILFSLSLLSVVAAPAALVADEITLPAGTRIEVRIDRELRSDAVTVGETFESTVSAPVEVGTRIAIPADSTIEGRVTVVRSGVRSGVIGVRFVRLRTADGHVYDLDALLAPTVEGETVPVSYGKKSAIVLIGSDADRPGKRASTVVGNSGEDATQVADRWSRSALSPERAYIASGSEMTVELGAPLTVEETTRSER
jgi:hypothetical protein